MILRVRRIFFEITTFSNTHLMPLLQLLPALPAQLLPALPAQLLPPLLYHHIQGTHLESTSEMNSLESLGIFLWMLGGPQSFRQAEDHALS